MSENPLVFDRKVLRTRRARARALGPATFLLERAATDLAERLAAVLRRFPLALDLGRSQGAAHSSRPCACFGTGDFFARTRSHRSRRTASGGAAALSSRARSR